MVTSPKSDSGSTAVAPPAAATPKKGKAKAAAKSVKPKTVSARGENKVANHPTSAIMVVEAITKLAEKNGSSLQAIKKSIADTHKVDLDKQSIHIKKALKKLVETGKLTQLTGQGAAGSFKLTAKPKQAKTDVVAEKNVKKAESSKKTTAKKPEAKKVAAPKKTVAPKAKKEVKPAAKATKKPAAGKTATPAAAKAKPASTDKKVAAGKGKAAPKKK